MRCAFRSWSTDTGRRSGQEVCAQASGGDGSGSGLRRVIGGCECGEHWAGVVGELSVAENQALEHLTEFTRGGVLDSQAIVSEFERTLRARYAEGKIDMETLKALLVAHRDEMDQHRNPDRRQQP